jgi:hypothetical protein
VLENGDFPRPGQYTNSVDDYLTSVAENEECTVNTRLSAATIVGVRQGAKQNIGLVKFLMLDGAHEAALKEFGALHRRA